MGIVSQILLTMNMFVYTIYLLFNLDKIMKDIDNSYEEIAKERFNLEHDEDDNFIRVAIFDDKAYWVYDNTLYETDIIDGDIDREASRPVDVFSASMNDVQRLMSVLDTLNKGE